MTFEIMNKGFTFLLKRRIIENMVTGEITLEHVG